MLEIGAGQGGLGAHLAVAGAQRVVAADFSAEAVAKTLHLVESRGLGNVTVDRADIHALPYAADLFDVVVSCETLEHVRDPGTAVRELARVLRPGGWLFLTVPNYLNLFALQRMYRRIVGRPYTEGGQPRNNFTTLPRVLVWVRGAGLQTVVITTRDRSRYLRRAVQSAPASAEPRRYCTTRLRRRRARIGPRTIAATTCCSPTETFRAGIYRCAPRRYSPGPSRRATSTPICGAY